MLISFSELATWLAMGLKVLTKFRTSDLYSGEWKHCTIYPKRSLRGSAFEFPNP